MGHGKGGSGFSQAKEREAISSEYITGQISTTLFSSLRTCSKEERKKQTANLLHSNSAL
jgi:hypothetical protein